MCQIIKKLYDVDPNNSEAVKEVLTSFFQQVPKHRDVEKNTWLRALETVICRFPKYCASHRNNIEVYLSNYLDSPDYFQVIGAAKCTHALQQVRLSQDRTATAKSCWRSQINSLCKAAHVLIDAVFENAVDMYKGVTENTTATSGSHFSNTLNAITKVPTNANKKSVLLLRLRNILVFIQAMLVEVYPVAKAVEPQIILDLVLRAQSVTSGSKINQELCRIKVEALRTLDALIVCLGSNLIPFSPLVLRFVMQTLRWSSDNPGEEASSVRCGAYRSCGAWLAALRSHRADAWAEQLAGHILQDLTPHKKSVQLTIGSLPIKHMSKKARRKHANAMLRESALAAHAPGEKNKIQTGETVSNEVAMAALSCAEIFLTVCGRFLKPTTHKNFQERVIRECFDTETYEGEHLLALLRVLEASRKTTPPGVAPPTQYCLHLYSVLLNRQDEISKFCTQALLDIRLHLHCSPPTLSFNVEAATEQHPSSKRKKVSEKNRAALENLLGKDRVSQLDDEIIVPDEPSPKKPRQDIDVDNISVSSNSISSVEISDDSDDEIVEIVGPTIEEDVENKTIEQAENKDSTPEEIQAIEKENETSMQNEENKSIPEKEINTAVQKEISPSLQSASIAIHEASTQAALNVSNETYDGDERPLSMEVSYDYPNTGSEKVTILEKEDGDNLPSTNETDDIQITCGQLMKPSQELIDKVSSSVDDESKTNGINVEVVVENGHDIDIVEDQSNLHNGVINVEPHKVNKNEGISVDEMMADFVDEVNEEAT